MCFAIFFIALPEKKHLWKAAVLENVSTAQSPFVFSNA